MSIKFHTYLQVHCEYCPRIFGGIGEFSDAGSARRAALRAGWKLIPKTLRSGRKGKRVDTSDVRRLAQASTTNHDACPECHPCTVCEGKPANGFTCNACGANGDV